MSIFIIIFIIVILFWIFLIFKYKKSYKISQDRLKFFNKNLKQILLSNSYKEQIIDMDKLFHKILLEAWYNWTFWEILKSEPSEIANLNKIWELHKLRNKLVHDFDLNSESFLKQKSSDYKKELNKLLNKIS